MHSKPIPMLLVSALSGIAAACLCFTVFLLLEARSSRTQLVEAQRQLTQALREANELRQQHTATTAELASQQQAVKELQEAEAARRLEAAADAAASPLPTRPTPVRIFDGNRYVGIGWMLAPSTNANARAAGENPLANVVLDGRYRSGSATAPSGDNSRAAGSSSSYAYQYQQYPAWWPVGWLGPGWGTDGECNPPPPPPPASGSAPPAATTPPTPMPVTRVATGTQLALDRYTRQPLTRSAPPPVFPPTVVGQKSVGLPGRSVSSPVVRPASNPANASGVGSRVALQPGVRSR